MSVMYNDSNDCSVTIDVYKAENVISNIGFAASPLFRSVAVHKRMWQLTASNSGTLFYSKNLAQLAGKFIINQNESRPKSINQR